MYVLGLPTVLHPLLSTTVRAWLVPPTLGTRVRLDLCLSPQPTMSTWAGPLDSRLGQAGVPNGFLHSMEVRVDGQCFATTVVLVKGRFSSPLGSTPSPAVRDDGLGSMTPSVANPSGVLPLLDVRAGSAPPSSIPFCRREFEPCSLL